MNVAAAVSGLLGSAGGPTAIVVGGVVAVVAATVGVFVVVRGQSFAGHALADLGAVGGSGAYLAGVGQLWGFVGAGVVAAAAMDAVGVRRMQARDVATGIVFSVGTGVTALFLFWDTTVGNASGAAVSVLFGSLFAVDPATVPAVVALGCVALVLVFVGYRWLQLETVHPDLAAARGVPVRVVGVVFLVSLALAVELSSLTVGAILSTALLIGPAASAVRVVRRFGAAIAIAVVLAVVETWAGCLLSYDSFYWAGPGGSWPVSFCIVAVVFVGYLLAAVAASGRSRLRRRGTVR